MTVLVNWRSKQQMQTSTAAFSCQKDIANTYTRKRKYSNQAAMMAFRAAA